MIYNAFGFRIQSEDLELPELIKNTVDIEFDISINEVTSIPQIKDINKIVKAGFEKTDNDFLLSVPDVSDYFVTNGNQIFFRKKNDDVSEDSVRLFLLGTCMGILMQQRGIICLHASGVLLNDKLTLFMGKSGAGKSSMLNYFKNKGSKVLGDDIVRIEIEDDKVYGYPSYPQSKLWKDGIDKFNLHNKIVRRIRPEIEKFGVKIDYKLFLKERVEIDSCFLIGWNKLKGIVSSEFNTIKKANLYNNNVYRRSAFQTTKEKKNLFDQSLELARLIPLNVLSRSRDVSISEFIDEISIILSK